MMRQIQEEGVCPFCPEELALRDPTPLIWQGEHWVIKPNRWKYEHTKLHLLVIAKTHVEKLREVTPEMWEELGRALIWIEVEHEIRSGALAMRFGEIDYNGATVAHLHAHVIVGDHDAPDFETVRFKVAARPVPKNDPGE
nr:Scavenger mRNA decapping enzyme C-term binding [uncultured bacterium]